MHRSRPAAAKPWNRRPNSRRWSGCSDRRRPCCSSRQMWASTLANDNLFLILINNCSFIDHWDFFRFWLACSRQNLARNLESCYCRLQGLCFSLISQRRDRGTMDPYAWMWFHWWLMLVVVNMGHLWFWALINPLIANQVRCLDVPFWLVPTHKVSGLLNSIRLPRIIDQFRSISHERCLNSNDRWLRRIFGSNRPKIKWLTPNINVDANRCNLLWFPKFSFIQHLVERLAERCVVSILITFVVLLHRGWQNLRLHQRRNAKHRLRWLMNYLYLPFWFLVLEVRLDTLYVIALCQELFRRTWLEFACEAALGHKFTFVLMRPKKSEWCL